ncbi:MAG TPA: TfoX/Sxy family protein [Bacteroidia bacterium]|nr:TfoX/Sxy family protein [Bacteroidia bacterium]
MAYSEQLAERVRKYFSSQKKLHPGESVLWQVEEKNMMGGLTFMVNGKMCVGVLKDELMARIAPELHDVSLKRKGCRTMDFTKKPMKGFVFVSPEGTKSKSDFEHWLNLALDFNSRARASKKTGKKKK